MKPPVRARAAPRRYGVDLQREWKEFEQEIDDWTIQDKRLLLRSLKKQCSRREPNLSLIEMALPHKNQEEITLYLEGLRGKSVRSLLQRNTLQRLREERQKQQQLRAPLQIWTELAEEATGKIDEVISTAFVQTLMIAATEPISQRELSQRPVPVSSAPKEDSAGSLPTDFELGSSGLPPVTELVPTSLEEPGAPAIPLDFEKIYQFLSAAVQGSTFPQLSPFESAVVLDLLMTLPSHLQGLNCTELWRHMNRIYRELNHTSSGWHGQNPPQQGCFPRPLLTPGPDPQRTTVPLSDLPQNPGTSCQPGPLTRSPPAVQAEQSQPPHASQATQSESEAKDGLEFDWPEPCPLNPFQLPVMLLVRCEIPTPAQDHIADPPSSSRGPVLTSDLLGADLSPRSSSQDPQ